MFRLEPKDIAQLVLQQRALLEAMYEGVFAVNEEKQLILINRAAREMLDIHRSEKILSASRWTRFCKPRRGFNTALRLGEQRPPRPDCGT